MAILLHEVREEGYNAGLTNPAAINPYNDIVTDYTSPRQAWQWGFDQADSGTRALNSPILVILGSVLAILVGLSFIVIYATT